MTDMSDDYDLSNNESYEPHQASLTVFNVGKQKCASGYEWGPGIRDHYLIHYISSGKGTYTCGSRTYKLCAGDLFLVRPDTLVSCRADSRDPWTYSWAGFSGTDAGTILEATDFRRGTAILRSVPYGGEFSEQLDRIIDAFGNSVVSSVRMTGELYLALAVLVSHAVTAPSSAPDDAEHVRRAAEYIDSHYSYPISIEDIAAYVGVSRSTLFRQFRRVLGVSPKEYLDQYRIRRAACLLRHTGLTISSVSVSVGYDNGLYFSKVFKKATGMSPSRYRTE